MTHIKHLVPFSSLCPAFWWEGFGLILKYAFPGAPPAWLRSSTLSCHGSAGAGRSWHRAALASHRYTPAAPNCQHMGTDTWYSSIFTLYQEIIVVLEQKGDVRAVNVNTFLKVSYSGCEFLHFVASSVFVNDKRISSVTLPGQEWLLKESI